MTTLFLELRRRLNLSKKQLQDSERRLSEADAKNFNLSMKSFNLQMFGLLVFHVFKHKITLQLCLF